MVLSQLFISYKQNQSILLWRPTFNLKSGVLASATWPRERHDMRSMYTVALMASGKRSWPQERLALKLSTYDNYWPTWKTGTNLTTGGEQSTRSNAPTTRLPMLVRLVETLTRDWTQTSNEKWWHQQSHCCTSSTDKPQHWLGHCSMLNLQYKLFSTTDSGNMVH